MAALERKNAKCFEKPTFGSYELVDYVYGTVCGDAAAAAEITLVGLCTDICVASNAILLRAKLPNTVIRVKADCCAGVTPASHQAALTTLAMCQMDII